MRARSPRLPASLLHPMAASHFRRKRSLIDQQSKDLVQLSNGPRLSEVHKTLMLEHMKWLNHAQPTSLNSINSVVCRGQSVSIVVLSAAHAW